VGQPVKLSDSLVLDARLSGELTERSIAAQIEFWAGLGRAIEGLLRTADVLALKKSGEEMPLSACLNQVGTPEGRKRLEQVLAEIPFPHYEPVRDRPGYFLRTDQNGAPTVGRFVNRRFVSAE